jgi:hypothetical protein
MKQIITSLSYDENEHLVLVKISGKSFNYKDLSESYKAIAQFAQKQSCERVLIDVTELRSAHSAYDIVLLVNTVSYALKPLTLAKVIGLQGYKNNLFLQKARQKELTIANFECFYRAKAWLLSA